MEKESAFFKLFQIENIGETDLKKLKKRYRVLCLRYHSDQGGLDSQFRFIKNAYDHLVELKKKQIKKESKKFFNTHLRFYHPNSIFDTIKNRWIRVKGKDL